MLLRVVGVLFWMMYVGGSLALFVEAVQWVADLAPLDERQFAFNAGLALVGWSGSRACTFCRRRLKASNEADGFSVRNLG